MLRQDAVRFSVVTVNLNTGPFLAETMESVLANLRQEDEYLVIDGGSTDGSVEIIRRYESQLAGWVSEPDSGYADALGKGFARSKGHLLAWINSGDLLLEGALARAEAALEETGSDMVFGDDFYVDEEGSVIFRSRARVHSLRAMMLYGGWTPLQDACFWRRSLYDRVGGLDPRFRVAADYDLFLRFSMSGVCTYVPAPFSAFRRHAGQKSLREAALYATEREVSRRAFLGRGLSRSIRERGLRVFYGAVVRLRARVPGLFAVRDYSLAGAPVRSLRPD